MTSEDRGNPTVDDDGSEDPRSSSISPEPEKEPEPKPEPKPEKEQPKRRLNAWQETLVLLVVAVVLAVVVKSFFVQSFYIPSESMEPGLVKNDRILVQKPSYWFGGPSRGDVVVFEDPGGWLNQVDTAGPSGALPKALAAIGLYPTGGHLVKRVVGTEGDVIECCDEQGRLMINGVAIEESDYARPGSSTATESGECYGPMPAGGNGCAKGWTVGPIPEGYLFVMGDNRSNSDDSSAKLCRAENPSCLKPFVDADQVVGKLLARVWPADRFDVTDGVDSFDDVPDPS